MTFEEKKNAFVALGQFLGQFRADGHTPNTEVLNNDLASLSATESRIFFDSFTDLIHLSQSHNGWYTPENVYFSIQSWANALTEQNLNQWLSKYNFEKNTSKTVGLVLAGNIPLVGFHDFMCVILSGHKVQVKTSSNDQHLLPFLANYLISIVPELKNYISFTEGKLKDYDAVIATGSNNTARYFDYYFKDKPSIIRKNRNSVAILNGTETKADLEALGEDIFRYFGLGCRNVSKIFVPKDYVFDSFFEGIFKYKDVIEYEKYANNYDYNKAVFLMSNFKLLDNGFLTIKEDASYSSPISSVFYEFYDHLDNLKLKLAADADAIQCIVSNHLIPNSIPFGKTQQPELWDYADGVDTLDFLASL